MCRLRICHNRYIEYTLMYIGYVEYNEYPFMYFITHTHTHTHIYIYIYIYIYIKEAVRFFFLFFRFKLHRNKK